MNLKRYFAQLGITRFILAAFLLSATWIGFEPTGAIIITASVIGILALTWIQFALTRLHIDGTAITQSGGFLPKKKLVLASLAPAINVIQYVEPGFGVFKRLLLQDTATGKKLSLSSLQWDEATIAAVREHLTTSGIHVESIETPTTIQQLSKAYPAYLPLFIRRPYLSATLIVLAIVMLIAVTVIIFQ